MNLDKIIEELRNEVNSIDEAIVALQRMLPKKSEDQHSTRQTPPGKE
jgi:hypothetical protein